MKKLFFLLLLLTLACNSNNSGKTRSQFFHKSGNGAFADLYSSNIDFPYTFTATVTSKVEQLSPETKDSPPQTIEYTEKIMLSRDQAGNYRGHRFLENGDGIRFTSSNQTFCTGFRYEKYICRPEEKNEVLRHRKNLWSSFTSSLKPIKHLIQKQKINTGKTKIYTISDKNSASRQNTSKPLAAFKILQSRGTIKADANNLPVSGQFKWQALFSQKTKKYKITLVYEHQLKKSSPAIKLPAPQQIFPYQKRKRPLQLRKNLLGQKTPPTLQHLYRD